MNQQSKEKAIEIVAQLKEVRNDLMRRDVFYRLAKDIYPPESRLYFGEVSQHFMTFTLHVEKIIYSLEDLIHERKVF